GQKAYRRGAREPALDAEVYGLRRVLRPRRDRVFVRRVLAEEEAAQTELPLREVRDFDPLHGAAGSPALRVARDGANLIETGRKRRLKSVDDVLARFGPRRVEREVETLAEARNGLAVVVNHYAEQVELRARLLVPAEGERGAVEFDGGGQQGLAVRRVDVAERE